MSADAKRKWQGGARQDYPKQPLRAVLRAITAGSRFPAVSAKFAGVLQKHATPKLGVRAVSARE